MTVKKMKPICNKCNFEISSIANFNKHIKKCDGTGPRAKKQKNIKGSLEWKKSISKGLKLKYKNDPEWKEAKKQKVIELYKNKILTGLPKTQEAIEDRNRKIKENMLQRYANGWETQCGRAKKIDYESPIAGKIKVDGNWELAVAKYLDSINVKWIRNKKRFDYINLVNKKSTYCPDFWVEDWNTFIEVKGYETDLDRCKWRQFLNPLEIWKKDKLKELKIL
jgi:hypothetical protein